MRIKLEDCPAKLRERIESALAKDSKRVRIAQDASQELGRVFVHPTPLKRNTRPVKVVRRGPNKTEAEYNRIYLHGTGRYEAITLRLPGGSRYTPDWVVLGENGAVELHEVKGSYRFGSHGRAATAFREAVAAFPCFSFIWATRKGRGNWEIRRHAPPPL